MSYEDKYKEFERYLTSGEPGVEERARNWSMAIGLHENIPKGIHRTFEPLERFMNFAVFGTPADLRNRTLHIRWNEPLRQNDASERAKRQNDVLETPLSFSEILSLKEMAVIRLIASDSKISIASITSKTGMSRRTIDRIIAVLKDKRIIAREGAKNNATWKILI